MTTETIPAKAIEEILFYLWCDEQKHFDEMKLNGENTDGHIFYSLEILNGRLERTTGRSIDDINEDFMREEMVRIEQARKDRMAAQTVTHRATVQRFIAAMTSNKT